MNRRFLASAVAIHVGACLIALMTLGERNQPNIESRMLDWDQPEAVREIQKSNHEIASSGVILPLTLASSGFSGGAI
jgi:hypothetical protein